jgi:hypothetical protein
VLTANATTQATPVIAGAMKERVKQWLAAAPGAEG